MIDFIEEKLKEIKLTTKEKTVLEYLTTNEKHACFQSAEEISRQLNVSPSTVIRLSAKLGFDNFTKLKKHLQKNAVYSDSDDLISEIPYEKIKNYENLSDQDLLSAIYQNIDINIKKDQESGQAEKYSAAADLLSRAERVYVVGFRACYGLASTFGIMLSCIRANVIVVGQHQPVIDSLIDAGPKDAAVLLSFKRYSKETALASHIARDRGCPVIAITDSLLSPISENASVLLINKVDNFTFHNSYVSTMMNLELLAGLVSKRNHSENLERLMRMEQYLDQTNQY